MEPPVPRRPKSITELEQEKYMQELAKKRPTPQQQLSFFDAFVANTSAQYTNLLEFFDAVPKFALTVQTSFKKGKNLEIQKSEFNWGDVPCSVSITPVVVEFTDPDTKEAVRKEVLPGPREETIYRVLKKMAADPDVRRVAGDKGVVLRFTLYHLRTRLKAVGHEYRIVEIREALQVLNRSALNVTNQRTRKLLYGGSYLDVKYTSSEEDQTGESSIVEVRFNDLAEAAVSAQLYDRIHYERLMSLRPLAAWIYELMTRNFRQAGAECGYTISLSRILRESGLQPRKDLRSNLRMVRDSLGELEKKGVLATYPAVKEEVQFDGSGKPGRKAIKEVTWTLFPSEDVVKDIRTDNADQLRRREKLALRR